MVISRIHHTSVIAYTRDVNLLYSPAYILIAELMLSCNLVGVILCWPGVRLYLLVEAGCSSKLLEVVSQVVAFF